ncbi:MAG: KamA family radical SAM protein [Desulfovibrionaceae bacterium]
MEAQIVEAGVEEPPQRTKPVFVQSNPMAPFGAVETSAGKIVTLHARRTEKFPTTEKAQQVYRILDPSSGPEQWTDWRWQFAHRIRNLDILERILDLTEDERAALSGAAGPLPWAVTPYYASLLHKSDSAHPLRRCMIPSLDELKRSAGEAEDPLAEDGDSPVCGLVHRYPDRVLFLATGVCSAYCRYCTRSRAVGRPENRTQVRRRWSLALEYIRNTPRVRDVLVSGGDPLTLSDAALEWLLHELRAIPHVEIIRLGTKIPAVLPQRVTPSLIRMLKKFHPLWMSLHMTHPEELTPESDEALRRLADAGIPLGSQTVLLKGVNDNANALRALFTGELQRRVRPYYLYQCDPVPGSSHFRTPVSRGLEMIDALRGHISGYAVPQYVIDAPGGGGKIPLLPEYVQGREGSDLLLRNFQHRQFRYPDTAAQETF